MGAVRKVPSHPQFLSSINAVGCLALFRTLAIHNRIPHPLKIELQNGNFILKKNLLGRNWFILILECNPSSANKQCEGTHFQKDHVAAALVHTYMATFRNRFFFLAPR